MDLFLIRREQMRVLAEATTETFEENVAAHLRAVWPDETEGMTEEVVRQWVRYAIEKGRRYEIETEFDVARFLDLMFLFDPGFDEDPRYPWAEEILNDPRLDGRMRVDALMVRSSEFCSDLESLGGGHDVG